MLSTERGRDTEKGCQKTCCTAEDYWWRCTALFCPGPAKPRIPQSDSYDRSSVTSLPCLGSTSWLQQTAVLVSAYPQATQRPEQFTDASKSMNCCLSQFREDTGEPSVPAQDINPIRYVLQAVWPDQNLKPWSCCCRSKCCNPQGISSGDNAELMMINEVKLTYYNFYL